MEVRHNFQKSAAWQQDPLPSESSCLFVVFVIALFFSCLFICLYLFFKQKEWPMDHSKCRYGLRGWSWPKAHKGGAVSEWKQQVRRSKS